MSGLLLALVTVVVMAIQTVITPSKAVNLLMSAVKLVVNIWLVYYFIKEFSKSFEVFTYGNGFSYGTTICLFSSFICVATQMAIIILISPEIFEAQIEVVINTFSQSNPEAADSLMRMQESGALLAAMAAFLFIYYFVFGVIVSAIVANFTKKGNLVF